MVIRYINLEEQTDNDFRRARRRASLRRMKARVRKDPASNRLLSFDEVKGSLGAFNQVYLGVRVVPVEKIVGSVNRYRDFDRAFLPARANLEARWKRIDRAYHRSEELPSPWRFGWTENEPWPAEEMRYRVRQGPPKW